tara:strand:+ start:77 stop:310 length:234 start_codon:yes stop_codon:yes gene_type:complete
MITHQIPIPDRSETANQKYHFYKLKIGDHMDVEFKNNKEAAKVRVAASNYGIRNNRVMVTRTYKEEVPFILRIWRQS